MILYRHGRDFASLCQIDSLAEDTTDAPRSFSPSLWAPPAARIAIHRAPRKPPGKGLWAALGPGLITGASDDDPSGIATYSQAGAQFGFAMCWIMLFTFPLMAAIQEISGRSAE